MVERLRIVRRFAELPASDLHELAAAGRFQLLKHGDVLFMEGDRCETLSFVISGSVKLFKHQTHGRKLLVDILAPGEAADESAVLGEAPHGVGLEAHADAEIFSIRREDYFSFLSDHPEQFGILLGDLSFQTATLIERLSELSSRTVQSRVAFSLFRLHRKFGDAQSRKINLPLVRQDIADMVGTTVETTIRVLSRFQKRKILRTTDHELSILKPECLRSIAETNCDCVHNPCAAGPLLLNRPGYTPPQ